MRSRGQTARLRAPSRIARGVAFVSLAFFAAIVTSATSACQPDYTQSSCKNVPAGGCPLSHGYTCDDPTCVAAYACNPDGTWTLDHMCPPADASADASDEDDSAVDATDATIESSIGPVPRDASIDVPPGSSGGPNCEPLEAPDCTLAFAVSCPSGCCDCEDLYVCTPDGWDAWGTCDLDAGIVQTQ